MKDAQHNSEILGLQSLIHCDSFALICIPCKYEDNKVRYESSIRLLLKYSKFIICIKFGLPHIFKDIVLFPLIPSKIHIVCCNSVIHYTHDGKNMGGLQTCLSEIIKLSVKDLSTICEILILLLDILLELDSEKMLFSF